MQISHNLECFHDSFETLFYLSLIGIEQ